MLDKYHPLSLFLYFSSVLIFTMFIQNPLLMAIALISGILFYLSLNSYRLNIKSVMLSLAFFIIITLTNPLFSHKGETALFYLNNNAVTLEAILYGANIGLMIIAIMLWLKCLNKVLTQEKILFLFGKISPKIALIISNSLRFIPMLKDQSKKIKASQKTMGYYSWDNYLDRLKLGVRAFSSVTTYALEKAIEIGQVMDSRGYGLKNRTYYSNYKFKFKDTFFIALIVILSITIIFSKIHGGMDFTFYPSVKYTNVSIYSIVGNASFSLLTILPFIINIREELKWKYYKSKI